MGRLPFLSSMETMSVDFIQRERAPYWISLEGRQLFCFCIEENLRRRNLAGIKARRKSLYI